MVLLPLCLSSFWPPLSFVLSFLAIFLASTTYTNIPLHHALTVILIRFACLILVYQNDMKLYSYFNMPVWHWVATSLILAPFPSLPLSATLGLCLYLCLLVSLTLASNVLYYFCLYFYDSTHLQRATISSYHVRWSTVRPWFLFHHTLCRFDLSSWDSTRFSTTSQLLSRLHCPLTESQRRVSSLSCRVPSFHLSLSHRLSLFSHQFTVFSSSIPSCDWPGCQLIS